MIKWLYIYRSLLLNFLVCSHLRPLSPPNIALAAPWLMNRPPHRKAGSSGFPFTGSTKPSTTVSAPSITALTNALFTWEDKYKWRWEEEKLSEQRKTTGDESPIAHCCCSELNYSFSWLPGAVPCLSAASPPDCQVEDLWLLATPHSSLEPMYDTKIRFWFNITAGSMLYIKWQQIIMLSCE